MNKGESQSAQHSSGFTLVETLIAIAVLMIAIAGPLVVASKGLTAALISRDQMTASLLAQESIEMVKNKKDNNIFNGDAWDYQVTGDGSQTYCLRTSVNDTQKCDFDPSSGDVPTDCAADDVGCALFLDNAGYNTTGNGQQSIFSRYFYLYKHGSATDEYTIIAVVSWYHGSIPYEVRLASEITSAIR